MIPVSVEDTRRTYDKCSNYFRNKFYDWNTTGFHTGSELVILTKTPSRVMVFFRALYFIPSQVVVVGLQVVYPT